MKKFYWSFFLLIGCVGIFYCSNGQSSSSPSAAQKIIIIRHGEKPDEGDNLSCQGFNRALQLPAVLNKKFGVPAFIYVPSINTGKNTSTARMYQTVMPFAIKYNLPVNTKYDVDDAEGLAQSILKKGGTTLVVWEHKAINNITKALGVEEKVKWENDDFDSIWIVTIENGRAKLTRDKEALSPAAACQ
ncbi:MAG: histidine phosphatase family protein [Bacteroidota bacterium]|nr:histidine phosphatase family protein [Bacteroidota bacterium]